MSGTATAVGEREATASRSSGTASNLIIKIVIVGLVDALLIMALARSISFEWWLAVGFFAFALIAVNVVYFSGRAMPFKYLLPGLLFLLVFQVYTMFFTAYASLTNYGTGHLSDKQSAITAIEQASVTPVEGAPAYSVLPALKDGTVSMVIVDPATGVVSIGTDEGVTTLSDADVQREGDKVVSVNGYEILNLATMSSNPDYKDQWDALRVPIDETEGIYLRPISITKATQAQAGFTYDEAQDAMVNTATGVVYPADGTVGNFISDTGEVLFPGWRVTIGFKNYASLLTDETLRNRFLPITGWTFFFAIATTFLNFSLGLALALVLSERRMRGQGVYRLLLIVPYGLPVILTALVWKGMLNTDFGLINQILGADIPWLTETWLARFSVLMVNLWLGFPYFLLVCSGALTAIPGDLKEAAYVDGASGRYAFRTVVLPLLLVATAPLLVTTFAFNFNNYTLIELLTGGGPYPGTVLEGGSTDLLINYTFRKAFNDSNQQLGLASAIAMVIFLIVGGVSAYGFRLTKRLEEIQT
jgi:arabinogalactan oligomer / maltooligosaccharide transport system permease protein